MGHLVLAKWKAGVHALPECRQSLSLQASPVGAGSTVATVAMAGSSQKPFVGLWARPEAVPMALARDATCRDQCRLGAEARRGQGLLWAQRGHWGGPRSPGTRTLQPQITDSLHFPEGWGTPSKPATSAHSLSANSLGNPTATPEDTRSSPSSTNGFLFSHAAEP